MARNCPRRFIILLDGGVRCRWACGAQKDFPEETAIDVEILYDHIPEHHHHHPHLHRR